MSGIFSLVLMRAVKMTSERTDKQHQGEHQIYLSSTSFINSCPCYEQALTVSHVIIPEYVTFID